MKTPARIAVYGAYGHTGRFIIAALIARGHAPIACGRDAARLQALAREFPGLITRVARIDDTTSLDQAFAGSQAIINAAGPFLDTAAAVIEAALRLRAHYLDTSAEQRAAYAVFERYGERIQQANLIALPSLAFYGALADLLATLALDDWPRADAIDIAVGLDSWHPTAGTRVTGQRNHWRRWHIRDGALHIQPDPAPHRSWRFANELGQQALVMVNLSEIVALSRHIACEQASSYMNLAPLRDLRDANTPAPRASDDQGRSAQRFIVEVRARLRGEERRAIAQGRDIYAITAPMIVEATERCLSGEVTKRGALAAGEAFDASDFLKSLARDLKVIREK